MINRRKKKYKSAVKGAFDISRTDTKKSTRRGYSYNMDKFGPHEDKSSSSTTTSFSDISGLKEASDNDTKTLSAGFSGLGVKMNPEDSLLNKQLDAIQTSSDDRADAEESNLDILDRGSRYKRKNEKLKKFKE